MAIVINIEPLPSQVFYVLLGGQNCTIKLYQRLGHMYIDLYVSETPICQGAICTFWENVLQFHNPAFVGSLRWLDLDGKSRPLYGGIGSRYLLIYTEDEDTDSDFAALEALANG